MNINDLFKRPSFYFIASQGWMFFLLCFAMQISILFNIKIEGFIWGLSQMYAIIYAIIILPIIQLFSLFTLIIKKNNANWGKLFFSMLFILIFIGISNSIIKTDIETEYRSGNYYIIIAFITTMISSVLFIFCTLLPYIFIKKEEIKKNIVIEKSFFIQNKFVLWGTLIGTFLYVLISLTCIIFTCGIFLIS